MSTYHRKIFAGAVTVGALALIASSVKKMIEKKKGLWIVLRLLFIFSILKSMRT